MFINNEKQHNSSHRMWQHIINDSIIHVLYGAKSSTVEQK